MPIFAAKEEDVLVQALFGTLAGAVIGLLVGSLINALWLLLANGWVGSARLGYGKAFKAVLTTNFVGLMLGMMVGLSLWYVVLLEGSEIRRNLGFLLSPVTLFYYMLGSVLLHAVLFSQILEDEEGEPLRFGRASALALVYLGICSAFSLLVSAVVLVVLVGAKVPF
jgi:hypothetical protein